MHTRYNPGGKGESHEENGMMRNFKKLISIISDHHKEGKNLSPCGS